RTGVPEIEPVGRSSSPPGGDFEESRERLRRVVPRDERDRRQLEGALPVPTHRPEDGPLDGFASLARTGAVGSLGRCGADGHWAGNRVLRGAHAILGG